MLFISLSLIYVGVYSMESTVDSVNIIKEELAWMNYAWVMEVLRVVFFIEFILLLTTSMTFSYFVEITYNVWWA